MVAAGHLARKDESDGNKENIVERDSPMNLRMKIEELEKKFRQVILADLYESPYKWSVEKTEERFRFPDMILSIDHDGYNRWYLDFKPNISGRRPSFHPLHLYGRIAMFDLNETDKFTIVVNDEKDFDMIKRRPPVSIRGNLYLMLIDLEWGKILKEEILGKFDKD